VMPVMPAQKPGKSKQVVGFPDYFVDSVGRVFSTRYKGRVPNSGICRPQWRAVSPWVDDDGYLRVHLVDESGWRRTKLVHRLVCLAFRGPAPGPRYEAQHRDGTRTNNRATNLKWGLPKDNADDRERHGRTARGSRSGTAKLTEAQVVAIRQRVARGELQKHIAVELGLHKSAISHVITGRNWGH